jgi:hypothetical protein
LQKDDENQELVFEAQNSTPVFAPNETVSPWPPLNSTGPETITGSPPPSYLPPSADALTTSYYRTAAFYGSIVGVLCAILIYTLICTALYYKIRSVIGRYNVTGHYNMDFNDGYDPMSSVIIPKWYECLAAVWRVGTCNCCKCVGQACVKSSNDMVASQNLHFA